MNHKPWQQGHFDGLCGIYSLMNSMVYLNPGKFNEDDCRALFCFLVGKAQEKTPNVICDGLDFEPLCDLAEHMIPYMRDNHGMKLGLIRPFSEGDAHSSDEFFEMLGFLANNPHNCAIIGLGEPWDHWSVVTKVSKKAVRFYDSYGIKRFNKSAFSLSTGDSVTKVDYTETILITKK